jgi:MYXO-CTERM domain-containing protein
MVGDGLGGTPEDVGNLVVFSGALIAPEPSASALGAAALLGVAALGRRARR